MLDELHPRHRVFGIVAVQRGAAGRLRDETAPLVVAKRLHIHLRSLCHLSDRQRHGLVLLRGNEGYTPYLGTGSRHPETLCSLWLSGRARETEWPVRSAGSSRLTGASVSARARSMTACQGGRDTHGRAQLRGQRPNLRWSLWLSVRVGWF